MGRHGGGSRSGGSRSSSRSSSGSGSSGSGARTSRKAFRGSYNRSYYDRRGRLCTYYTTDKDFGVKKGWRIGTIISLIFITLHMCMMMSGVVASCIQFGGKVNGDMKRIYIEDKANLLSSAEEVEIIELFHKVYKKSGMPITLYTDDYSWKEHYYSIETYSEYLYYKISYAEDAMIILFTVNEDDDFFDWEYDMYCGDDTVKCLSDEDFDKLLSNFQKAMANDDLAKALDYAWNSVIDDMAKTKLNFVAIPMFFFLGILYAIFYFALLGSAIKNKAAYKYFQENPHKLSMEPITSFTNCAFCGVSNPSQNIVCEYCGAAMNNDDFSIKVIPEEDSMI